MIPPPPLKASRVNQTLNTNGATDVKYFTIHGEHFLAVANALNAKSTKEGFVLCRFEAGTFKEIQRIPINNIRDIHYFIINTRKFMAVSKTFSNQVSIYEWKNEKLGNKIQIIAIKRPGRCKAFAVHTIMYMSCGSLVSKATTVLI